MAADPQRMLANLRELAKLTGTDRGAQRVAWTDTWKQAREWERGLLDELPVAVEIDEAGNLWATLEGESPDTLIIGSHIDSVPDGGWLDGCLGVLSALEVLRALAVGDKPPLTVKLIDWADEEGARFGLSLVGSSAAAGTLDPEMLRRLTDVDGVTAGDALAAHDVDVAEMHRSGSRLQGAVGYIELHIEQGPVLEARDLSLGVVTGTYGTERWAAKFTGQAAHSGSTPMDQRRDSLLAASQLALKIRQLALDNGGVGTVGRIGAEPGIPTAVAGVATALVDQRHENADVLAKVRGEAEQTSRVIAEQEDVEVEWSPLFRIAPIPFDAGLIETAGGIIEQLQGTDMRLPSGPLHDAARVAEAGRSDRDVVRKEQAGPVAHALRGHRRLGPRARAAGAGPTGRRQARAGRRGMMQSQPRPQDRLRLREDAPRPEERLIEPRSAALWTVLSLPLVGYFFWYYLAHRDCSQLAEDDATNPWFWLAMIFPGMVLVIPYAAAQAKIVARVEIATRKPFSTAAYLGLCIGGFFIPAVLPLFLQPRLNEAGRVSR